MSSCNARDKAQKCRQGADRLEKRLEWATAVVEKKVASKCELCLGFICRIFSFRSFFRSTNDVKRIALSLPLNDFRFHVIDNGRKGKKVE
jgi:hypothetical protein